MMHSRHDVKTTQNNKATNVNMLFRNSRRTFMLRETDLIHAIAVTMETAEEN